MKKVLEFDHVSLDHLEDGKAAVQSELTRFRHEVILSCVPQYEQPWFAGLLTIRRISFRTAANGRHADAVGIAEMNLEGRDRFAVLHFHQRHAVSTPDLPKGASFDKQSDQAITVTRHRLRTYRVQRNQDVIGSLPKSPDPVLRVALAGIGYQFRALSGAGDERAERFEREARDALLDFQRDQPGPGDAKVQTIVGLAAWGVSGIVARSRLEPDVPIFRSGDFGRVGFIAIDEPAEQLAGLRGNADREQEMPHHRHLVTTEDEALNIAEVEWVLRTGSGAGIASRHFVLRAPEQTAEEASAFFRRWRLGLVVLTHSAPPFMIRPR